MSKAIEEMHAQDEHNRLMRLADFQQRFVQRYGLRLKAEEGIHDDNERASEDLRFCFQRDLTYLIHLVYREAQEPLVKQLTEFVTTYNRPFVIPTNKL